jgi:hypothetical protein
VDDAGESGLNSGIWSNEERTSDIDSDERGELSIIEG